MWKKKIKDIEELISPFNSIKCSFKEYESSPLAKKRKRVWIIITSILNLAWKKWSACGIEIKENNLRFCNRVKQLLSMRV